MGEQRERSEVGQPISRDDIFDLLSNHRRRYALHFMKASEGPFELGEIAKQVAAWENEKSCAEVTSDERHRVYTSLQQVHLPAMDTTGIINYDNGTVTLNDQAADVDIYMDVVPEDSISWAHYYLGLAGICTGIIAGVWIGIFPSSVPGLVWAGLVVTLFFVSAAVHTWRNRMSQLGVEEIPPEVK